MEAVTDLQETLQALIAQGTSPLEIVVIEESPDYPGELVFQPFEGEQSFYSRYREWVSRYLVLSEVYNLPAFIDHLNAEGWVVVLGPSCEPILKDYERFSEPLKIEGYELHPFQQFSLQRAFETDYWFWNWSTGAGKSFCCAAGAKELVARGQIDQVIACTVSKSKEDLRRFFEQAGLDAVVNDGTKDKRRRGYAQRHQCYVANYEKLWVDYAEIEELVVGARTLFIFDECHKIVTADKQNKARQAFEKLTHLAGIGSKIWPMSASVVDGNPLRFHDVFGIGQDRNNPLGTRAQFERSYADDIKVIEIKTKTGRRFPFTVYDWNHGRLQEVRHRVGDRTQAVRKTDPGVREFFKGMATIVEPVQASLEEHKLYDFIIDRAREAWQREENLHPYYHLLRCVANIPTALLHTHSEVGQEMIRTQHWDLDKLIVRAPATKLAKLNEQLESIRESGDKVVVFTAWTNMTLHLIKDQIEVPHVVHFGVGQSDKESQQVKDEFKSNPDITCFLTSDAGAHGINMQEARYVIQYDPTYSYDLGMQRASRIDRADSHLDGLTNYVYVTENSIEERVWAINNARREVSAVTQGTEESFSHGDIDRERALRSEAENMAFLIFGDRR